MIKIICNRCGRELVSNRFAGYVSLDLMDLDSGDLVGKNSCEMKHFCETCMEDIRSFVMEAERGEEHVRDTDSQIQYDISGTDQKTDG